MQLFPDDAGGRGDRVLVVGAHPDDELLGLGGTLRRHVLRGDEVHVLILCENMSLRYRSPEEAGFDTVQHARRAAGLMGFASVQCLGFPDQRLDAGPILEVIRPIERLVKELQPRYVYTHWSGDINRDHRVAHEATLVACRCKAKSVELLLAYETASETEFGVPYNFSPNFFVDISATLPAKLEALACYESEMEAYPNARSLQAIEERARTWGQAAGMPAAEPFQILRSYWRKQEVAVYENAKLAGKNGTAVPAGAGAAAVSF
jgi:LmbE family N-acetylglucosaminyl deacetylase